jgi:beta-barrel assembly-enhancing protease
MFRASLLALVVVSTSCTLTQRRDTEKAIAQTLISDDQEFQLGLQVHEQLKKDNTKFLENAKVELYVESLARKLIGEANKERPLEWRWFVIDDPTTINAFATPGGRIYVYTGLLLSAENEAEVIGVLGHEIGHVVGRHSARQLVATNGLQSVIDMALGKNAGEVAKLTAGLAGKGAQLAYGRDMELEADQYGARYASRVGYDPRGLATFFEKLKAKYGDTGPVLTLLSTHPANSDRINQVTALIAAENLTGTELGVASLKAVQAELGKK